MPYYIFEGPDGVGKSTAIQNVTTLLMERDPKLEVVITQLPGTTALGKHLRTLVKTPHEINPDITMNPLTRQLLYAVDYSSFVIDYLKPLLDQGKTVLCDRCSAISSKIYGHAEGVNFSDLENVYDIIPSPKADIIFILNCDPTVSMERMKNERGKDHFDHMPMEFKKKLYESYSCMTDPDHDLHKGSLRLSNSIIKVNATYPRDTIAHIIVQHIKDAKK